MTPGIWMLFQSWRNGQSSSAFLRCGNWGLKKLKVLLEIPKLTRGVPRTDDRTKCSFYATTVILGTAFLIKGTKWSSNKKILMILQTSSAQLWIPVYKKYTRVPSSTYCLHRQNNTSLSPFLFKTFCFYCISNHPETFYWLLPVIWFIIMFTPMLWMNKVNKTFDFIPPVTQAKKPWSHPWLFSLSPPHPTH